MPIGSGGRERNYLGKSDGLLSEWRLCFDGGQGDREWQLELLPCWCRQTIIDGIQSEPSMPQ
jgi:hypothetical protein